MPKKTNRLTIPQALHEEVASLARSHAKIALEALVDELQNGTGASRVAAAGLILERGFGKGFQNLDAEGNIEVDLALPDEVLNVLDGIYMHLR